MSAPVPQAAVDALRVAEEAHVFEPYEGRCRCGFQGRYGEQGRHLAEHVAAAVVAAVQGPIKAEALREAAGEFEEFAYVDDKRFKTVNTAAVRLNAARILRARADAIEAQP